ncbi:hypothetical protein FOA43_004804 [Brettanomyces nanus]|uniref:M-phase inducer phosphatase n=1 Tax=Eeniella nana TaxID=13502 RepID=A0A875S741_EENNA|nr:uncharacterized protein FOA43_004804 [Brettanomyces nanus]QPG77391.1 hypothetical protein FOA43_004804 [Brettanomyces nanus]
MSADMEIDSPHYTSAACLQDSNSAKLSDSPSSSSTMAELMGSPLFNASLKLKRSRSSMLGHHRSNSSLKRQPHTLAVLPFTDLEDKENYSTCFNQSQIFGKLSTINQPNASTLSPTAIASIAPAVPVVAMIPVGPVAPVASVAPSSSTFRKHVRKRSGTNFRSSFSYQHYHHHSRSNSTVSTTGSIFKIHSRSTSANSRGLQEALDLFTSTESNPTIPDPTFKVTPSFFDRQPSPEGPQLPPQSLSPETCAALDGHHGFQTGKSSYIPCFPMSSTPNLQSKSNPLDLIDLDDDPYDVMDDVEDEAIGDNQFGEAYGSPLQQRQQTRRRLELNARIKRNLHRATSLINCSPITTDGHNNDNHVGNSQFNFHQLGGPIEECEFESEARPRLTRSATTLTSADNEKQLQGNGNILNHGNSLLPHAPLRTFYPDGCTLPHITVDQFHDLLVEHQQKQGKLCNMFDEMVIVDCRFEYEFQGGHIEGAINVSSKSELEDAFFFESVIKCPPQEFTDRSHKLLVFHCEFSSHRGPLMANSLRNWDRCLNRENYPNLYYPDIVILEGGYKKYFDKFVSNNHSYVEMQDPQFRDECERGLDKLRRDNKLSLSRKSSISSSLDISLSRKSSYATFNSSVSSNSSNSSTSSSISNASSSLGLKRTCSASTTSTSSTLSSLDFGNSAKVDFLKLKRSLFGEDDTMDTSTAISGIPSPEFGIFGGFGNRKVDLDNLCSESPMGKRVTQPNPSPIFKQPMLPRRLSGSSRHRRAETISCFTYGMSGCPKTKKFERHIDTPITREHK